jgi:hypothetical protein
MSLSSSVGWQATNRAADVFAVYDRLVRVPASRGGPSSPLAKIERTTLDHQPWLDFVEGIVKFQRFHFSWEPDGVVEPNGKTWQRLEKEAAGGGSTGVDYNLLFTGTELRWVNRLPPGVTSEIAIPATSGMPGYQSAAHKNTKDKGPIPEGLYSFQALWTSNKDRKARIINESVDLDKDQGIQLLPHGGFTKGGNGPFVFPEWGRHRVRLKVESDFTAWHRSGFYIHDSHKGASHGCIEVLESFFNKYLIPYAEWSGKPKTRLRLRVKYPSATASTRGDTLRPRFPMEYGIYDPGGYPQGIDCHGE